MVFRIVAGILLLASIAGGSHAQECANRCVNYSLISPQPDQYSSYYWNLTNNCPQPVYLCGCTVGNCDSAGCYNIVAPGQSKRVTNNRSARSGDTLLVYIAYQNEFKPNRGAEHEAWMSRYDQKCGGLTRYNVR